MPWANVVELIATEESKRKEKGPRIRKGSWMQNRRESGNTRKARICQFTERSFEQNKKAAIHKIIEGSFSLSNVEQVYPNIAEVEQTYVKRSGHGNNIDDTQINFPDSYVSYNYGVFTDNEVPNSLKELKRETAAGIDKIRIQVLKSIPISHITALMNYW